MSETNGYCHRWFMRCRCHHKWSLMERVTLTDLATATHKLGFILVLKCDHCGDLKQTRIDP